MRRFVVALVALTLAGCASIPDQESRRERIRDAILYAPHKITNAFGNGFFDLDNSRYNLKRERYDAEIDSGITKTGPADGAIRPPAL